MRYPKFLPEGGKIGFIAPSFGCATEPYISRFDEAICHFRTLGYRTVLGPNSRACEGIGKSNTPEKCADEINDFFCHERSDVIISCGGGELMCEDVPFVDFSKISAAEPKWFIGYSDNTNLTFLLPTLCDTAAIYGPNAGDFGMKPWHPSIEDAFSFMKGEKLEFSNYDGWEKGWPDREAEPTAPYYITEDYKQVIYEASSACFEGRMIGGCMDVLSVLCGTKYDKVREFLEKYLEDGFIWYLEACDLGPMGIRRALWQFREAGWFKYVKGFVIGRPLHYEDDFDGFTCHDAVTGILKDFGVPIVMDVDLGHLSPMIPFISGAIGRVEATGNRFDIRYTLK